MAAWADGSASTANTTSEAASIIVDAITPSVSIPVRGLAEPELTAAPDTGGSRLERAAPSAPRSAEHRSHAGDSAGLRQWTSRWWAVDVGPPLVVPAGCRQPLRGGSLGGRCSSVCICGEPSHQIRSATPTHYRGDVQLTRFPDLALRFVMRLAVIEPPEAASSRTTHRVAEDVEVAYAHAATAVARLRVLGVFDTSRGRGGGVNITEFGREVLSAGPPSSVTVVPRKSSSAQETILARSGTDVASEPRWPERGRHSSRNWTPPRWLISPPPLPGQSLPP